jgi:hypothetical protein
MSLHKSAFSTDFQSYCTEITSTVRRWNYIHRAEGRVPFQNVNDWIKCFTRIRSMHGSSIDSQEFGHDH